MNEQPHWAEEGCQFSGLSGPELRFNRHWRELIDRAGGQARVVNRIGWTKSTVSRDYRGEIPPSDERLSQLCGYLKLSRQEHGEILRLLEQARLARQARKAQPVVESEPSLATAVSGLTPEKEPPAPGAATADLVSQGNPRRADRARHRSRERGKVAALVGGGVLAGVLLAAAALLLPDLWQGRAPLPAGVPVAQGSFRGMGIKTVAVAKSSLTPALADALGHGRMAGVGTVDGYVFRNMDGPDLCLTAAGAGSAAGQDGDRVEVATCDGAASQVWIPEQWEAGGTRFTWLVNDRYQSKCLNARNRGGLRNGQRTMLWDCYQSPNEYWDFGDWHANVKTGTRSYPIFVESGRFCLDADKYDFRNGTYVNIWGQYATAVNQFWS
jgi:hypothetical protein